MKISLLHRKSPELADFVAEVGDCNSLATMRSLMLGSAFAPESDNWF